MAKEQLYWEDVEEGQEVPTLVKKPTAVQMFMHSAITWNRHRIHYDKDWAQKEGYPDIVIHGPLHGNALCELMTNWIGDEGFLRKISLSNRAPAFLGDTLTCTGKVTRKYVENGEHLVDCEIKVENPRGEVTAPGTATVRLPSRGG